MDIGISLTEGWGKGRNQWWLFFFFNLMDDDTIYWDEETANGRSIKISVRVKQVRTCTKSDFRWQTFKMFYRDKIIIAIPVFSQLSLFSIYHMKYTEGYLDDSLSFPSTSFC